MAEFATQPIQTGYYSGPPTPVVPSQLPVIQTAPPPKPTTLVMPSIVGAATTVLPSPQPSLAPADLLHQLPSIVNTQPAVAPPTCPANPISQWVTNNPLLAVGVLAAAAYFFLGLGKD